MTFKQNWEKTRPPRLLSPQMIEKMVKQTCPEKKLLSQNLISGGCANLNIKVNFEGEERPSLLRIYLRDPIARQREQKIGDLVYKHLTVPRTLYKGEYEGYSFAITEFVSGLPLREVLLSQHLYNVENVMFEVGFLLTKLNNFVFPTAGFFDENLNVAKIARPADLWIMVQDYLKDHILLTYLDVDTLKRLCFTFKEYHTLLLSIGGTQLVHGDFDPANILVSQIDNVWKVSGILDWEFAFAGSILWDVATMLRYAHQMPPFFEADFLRGIESEGVVLPDDWQTKIHLLNLISLIELLIRTDPKESPQRGADICALIKHVLTKL